MSQGEQDANELPRDVVLPELMREFPEQFAAVLALDDVAQRTRPPQAPEKPHGGLLLRIYARGTKTFRGSVHLVMRGYGIQAGMLNRSLFEDTLIAHWVVENEAKAFEQMEKSIPHELSKWEQKLTEHQRPMGPHLPSLTKAERKKLRKVFGGGKTWTGLNLYQLRKAVESQFPSEADREFLGWVYDFPHLFNTQLLHQTPISLQLAAEETEHGIRFDTGPSNIHIHGALVGAFWGYANLASIVLEGEAADELQRVYAEHMSAFHDEGEPADAS